uniref:Methyltransferase n=1 Tax=viral metagenome TaxID=1070528 RepID=A0A6C0JKB7_9ZZZZ
MDFIKSEYENKNNEKQNYLEDLKKIIINSNSTLEGNCFYYHESLNEFSDLYSKQLNLFWCGKQAINNICEIGFNAGHSTMLLLLGRNDTPLNFTIFDIGHHSYTKPSYEYIKSKFSHVNFEYVEGDSTITMPQWIIDHPELINKYDIVHVDGGHSEHCIFNDMKNTDLLVKKDGIVIIDDTNSCVINKFVDLYLSTGNYKELSLLSTQGYPHRVIKKIK